jgi:hypothetical protein
MSVEGTGIGLFVLLSLQEKVEGSGDHVVHFLPQSIYSSMWDLKVSLDKCICLLGVQTQNTRGVSM